MTTNFIRITTLVENTARGRRILAKRGPAAMTKLRSAFPGKCLRCTADLHLIHRQTLEDYGKYDGTFFLS